MKLARGLALIAAACLYGAGHAFGAEPERKALAYLEREVPRWRLENHCASCHNNGDAARALYQGIERSEKVAKGALDDTNAWLGDPEAWDRNGGDGPFSDKRLARLQFASSLAAAIKSGSIRDPQALTIAARKLADDQAPEGFWPIDEGAGTVGAPASYGRALATLSARDTLKAADSKAFAEAIKKADRWLLKRPLADTPNLASALAATAGNPSAEALEVRERAFERLRSGESNEGGWGPFADAPAEPFDTAIVVLALSRLERSPTVSGFIKRGRGALIASQEADGSWPETTRPSGGQSYAERVSTTAWATLALFATEP